eukprot:13775666-Alexandrium_andersonii.AAC.1
MKTSRTRWFSGKSSRTMLHRSDSESPDRFAQLATTLRSGSRNSSSQWNQSWLFCGPTPRM